MPDPVPFSGADGCHGTLAGFAKHCGCRGCRGAGELLFPSGYYDDVSLWGLWPKDVLVIVPCYKGKLSSPAPAVELYTGPMFTLGLRAARACVSDDQIRILSARHGFVELTQALEPYDVTWGHPLAIGRQQLQQQAEELGERSVVVSLGGATYSWHLSAIWPEVRLPLHGTRGIGEQRQRLAALASRAPGSGQRPWLPAS